MATQDHIRLGVAFYPDWFFKHYGISFGKKYYFDPETRVQAGMEMEKALYERFGDVGLGDPDPEPKPLITFGMVMLPAIFGCKIIYEDSALPWAMPLNLSRDEIMNLEVPDIFNSYPMTEMLKQIDYLREKYGKVVGDINTTGVQNLALKVRGDQLYIDYFEDPELCHHLLKICTECIIQLFKFNKKTTGTGALDVTPMCNPKLYVLPNCTIEQISLDTFEKYLLEYDNMIANTCGPIGIHHCGSVNEVLDGYAKVQNLEFIEVGFGSDVKRTRKVFGPDIAVNARINPVLMKNGTTEEVAAEVRRLIDQGDPLENFSIDTVGLTYGTPDENVKTARRTAAEYGKISRKELTGLKSQPFHFLGFEKKPTQKTTVSSSTNTVFIGSTLPLTIIGERINPTGRKRLAQDLREWNLDLVKSEALKQVEQGAHILDINVGVSGIDEPKLLKEAIIAIQAITDVPLCIDSALPKALGSALAVYKGKALVNSVNGEKDKLDQVLPLVREHNAAVIGLTMDDEGIPEKAEKRLAIAARIVERAEKQGIPREDVIIDPLAMAVSANHESSLETLKAIHLINHELCVNQTLGLSNISFGLPHRMSVNVIFLAMAALAGLTSTIVDPTVWEMRRALLIADMLLGKDEFCMKYLAACSKRGTEGGKGKVETALDSRAVGDDLELLKQAVIVGKRKEAVSLTRQALAKNTDPQILINNYLIPALNIVGEKFEQKKIFIPEMMMSARSMQTCMDLIKPLLKTKKDSEKILGTVVLGTVFGDLHDIGKNLVRLLMETSGFKVIDLGENVPPEKFVNAAKKHNAHIVGLSSLLTTGDPYVKETIRAIRKSDIGSKVKIICGGAAITQKFAEACGADSYAKDAAEGVRKSKALLVSNTGNSIEE